MDTFTWVIILLFIYLSWNVSAANCVYKGGSADAAPEESRLERIRIYLSAKKDNYMPSGKIIGFFNLDLLGLSLLVSIAYDDNFKIMLASAIGAALVICAADCLINGLPYGIRPRTNMQYIDDQIAEYEIEELLREQHHKLL